MDKVGDHEVEEKVVSSLVMGFFLYSFCAVGSNPCSFYHHFFGCLLLSIAILILREFCVWVYGLLVKYNDAIAGIFLCFMFFAAMKDSCGC